MKKNRIYLLKLVIESILSFLLITCNIEAKYELTELNPGFDYGSWYKSVTGFAPNPQWFGAWVIAPHKDELYFGFGTARPAESDGALLAKWQGDSLVPLGQFSEQGVHCIKWFHDTLLGIGSDPSITDGWDGGNFYKYYPDGKFIKIRYNSTKKPVLPNVLHSWGFCIDTVENSFYMSTGSYDPVQYAKNNNGCGKIADSTIACFGQIFQTTDNGNSWILLSGKRNDILSPYRAMDVIKYHNKIYVTNSNMYYNNDLKVSSDSGKTWQVITGIIPSGLYRMIVFKNQLIVVSNNGGVLYTIDENSVLTPFYLPGTLNYSFNALVNVEDRFLFTYFSDGSLKATFDLTYWTELIPAAVRNFVSIAYWEKEKSIVLAERDSIGKIWKVDISDLLATGIKEKVNENNPDITIRLEQLIIHNLRAESGNIQILDIFGRDLTGSVNFIKAYNDLRADISQLPKGLYFVILIVQNTKIVQKIIRY